MCVIYLKSLPLSKKDRIPLLATRAMNEYGITESDIAHQVN